MLPCRRYIVDWAKSCHFRFISEINMGLGAKERSSSHLVSFLLGAALPTTLLFFLASDRLSEGFSRIPNSWGNGTILPPIGRAAMGATNLASDVVTAPAQVQEEEFPGLAELLAKVAMDDKTVIFTSVNEVWTRPNSLLDIFLNGFRTGEDTAHLLDHVLIVAVDSGGFEGCKAVHPHCYLLEIKSMNMSRAQWFGSKEYMELIWLKLSLQQRALELGYSFLYTDADILWLRNPLRHISVYADMSCSLDNSKMAPVLLDNEVNCGFYYMRSTTRSIKAIKYWRAARARFPPSIEQTVFNNIKHELVSDLGVRILPLETEYVSGFCDFYDHGLDKVCTIHANCCMGLENKVHDLKNVAADWKNYTSLTPEQRKKGSAKLTTPTKCRKSMGWD